MSCTVLLFKEASGADDPFATALRCLGYRAVFVPVLAHILVNETDLVRRLEGDYAGLIVTSKRAVEALSRAQQHLQTPTRALPLTFVVGPSTRRSLTELSRPPTSIAGDDTGSGEKLSHAIVQHFRRPPTRPLLYLTGDKRSDTLPAILTEHGIELEQIEVYRTRVREDLEGAVKMVLEGISFAWIAFFSPSGVRAAIPLLKQSHLPFRVAAIGPTTQECLLTEWGIVADAVPLSPSAEAFAQSLAGSDVKISGQ